MDLKIVALSEVSWTEKLSYDISYMWNLKKGTNRPIYRTEVASLVAQLVKNLPAMWKTWVQSLGWEDPLEKEKATHSSILA